MKPYRKVPLWWWFGIIVVVLAMSIAMTEVFHTGLPVYGIFLAFIIPAIYMVPCGMIQGVTNVCVLFLLSCVSIQGGAWISHECEAWSTGLDLWAILILSSDQSLHPRYQSLTQSIT